jgi:hypothetical protein
MHFHTGEFPFYCPYDECKKKGFAFKEKLEKHVKKHSLGEPMRRRDAKIQVFKAEELENVGLK